MPNIAEHGEFQKPEKELSNTLMVSELGPYINLTVLEEVFNEKCMQLQTSMPEDIRFLESLRAAYVIFPSIPVAVKVYESTGGVIYINGNNYRMEYTPNFNNNFNHTTNKSITYIRNTSESSPFTTAMETTVHEDWICEFVRNNYYFFSAIAKIFLKDLSASDAKEIKLLIVELSP